MDSDRPTLVQVKVLFWGGEAWKDAPVLEWTARGNPIVRLDGKQIIPTPGEWRFA